MITDKQNIQAINKTARQAVNGSQAKLSIEKTCDGSGAMSALGNTGAIMACHGGSGLSGIMAVTYDDTSKC